MNVATIRSNLATRLATVTAIKKVHASIPAQIPQAPAAVLGFPEISYDETMGDGGSILRWPIYVVTGSQDQQQAQSKLDAFLTEGTGGVRAAIDGDLTLSGAVDSMRLVEWVNSGANYIFGDATYVGVTGNLEIYA